MRKRTVLLALLSLVAVSLSTGVAAAAPAAKVDVCHFDADTATYHLINISDNAFEKHVEHGDYVPGAEVPGMPHYVFGPDCGFVFAPYLVETVLVGGKGLVATSAALDNGASYELRASGTYRFANWGEYGIADALCNYRSAAYNGGVAGWVNGDVWASPYTSWLQVFVEGGAFNWSPHTCQTTTHDYTGQITGDGTAIDFRILDDNYSDNSGSISVAIWKMTP